MKKYYLLTAPLFSIALSFLLAFSTLASPNSEPNKTLFSQLDNKQRLHQILDTLKALDMGNIEESIVLIDEAFSLDVTKLEDKLLIGFYKDAAQIFMASNNNKRSIDLYEKGISLAIKLGDKKELAFFYMYSFVNRFTVGLESEQSKDYAQLALKIAGELNDPSLNSTLYYKISTYYTYQKRFDKAKEAVNVALDNLNDDTRKDLKFSVYGTVNYIAYYSEDYDWGIRIIKPYLGDLSTVDKETEAYGVVAAGFSDLLMKAGRLDEAEEYLLWALKVYKKLNLTFYIPYAIETAISLYIEKKDYEKANQYYQEFLKEIEGADKKELKLTAIQVNIAIAKGERDFEKFAEAKNKEMAFHIETLRQTTDDKLLNLEVKYDVEKKEAENLRLAQENKIQQGQLTITTLENDNLQRTVWFGLLLITVFIIGGFLLLKLNGNLRVARKVAEDNAEEKAKFLATMSHEIRTPMNGVVGMIDVLRNTDLSNAQDKMIRTIKESGMALLTIINDLLDFSKLEAGKLQIERIPMSIISTVEGVSETLLPLTAKNSIKLMTFIDPAVPHMVVGDPVRIRQIIFNIAGNAMKFTGTVEGKPGIVTLNVGVCDGKLSIAISDNGIGMSPEFVATMFEEYSQAESGTARKFGGTGLGLSICKTLTDLMDGSIEVTSEIGKGSVFTILLPLEAVSNYKSDWPSLNNIRYQAEIETEELKDFVATYCDTLGAKLVETADIIIVEHNESDGEIGAYTDSLRKERHHKGSKFLVLSDNRLLEMGSMSEHLSIVENHPIALESFHKQLAMLASGKTDVKVTPKKAKANIAPTREEALAAGRLILVADDNKTNLMVITRQLGILGYTCDTAADGEIALGMWVQNDYALLITDWHMPNMTGWDLAAAVRKRERDEDLKRIPIIAATGTFLSEDNASFANGDVDMQLMKPLEMAKLNAALSRVT